MLQISSSLSYRQNSGTLHKAIKKLLRSRDSVKILFRYMRFLSYSSMFFTFSFFKLLCQGLAFNRLLQGSCSANVWNSNLEAGCQQIGWHILVHQVPHECVQWDRRGSGCISGRALGLRMKGSPPPRVFNYTVIKNVCLISIFGAYGVSLMPQYMIHFVNSHCIIENMVYFLIAGFRTLICPLDQVC